MTTRKSFIAAASAAGALALMGAGAEPAQKFYSPGELQADLDGIWQALLDVGAQPFRTSSRERVEALYRSARASIAAPMPVMQAWLTMAPVLGALNDAHVFLGFPGELNKTAFAFPMFFSVSDTGDALTLLYDRTQKVPSGSRVLSVNGIASATYISTALATLGAQTPSFNRERIGMGGSWPAVALFGAGPYRVRYISPLRETESEEVVPATETLPAGNAKIAAQFEPYAYKTLRDGKIGYIDYKLCEDLPRFKTFLATTFAKIKAAPVRALVIDVRFNGGGNSALNDELWQYASDKPFKQEGATIVKSCDRLKREYGEKKYVEIYNQEAWDAPNGKLLTFGDDPNADLIEPRPLETRYAGPVYLLISKRTFSSAMSCALAAKDYGLATIVGEETGEPVSSTGELYEYVTPNVRFHAGLTTKVFLAPKPHPDNQGVVPDVAVAATTVTDLIAGHDPVLDRAIALALG